MANSRRFITVLSWIWVLIVTAHLVMGWMNYTGAFRWAAELQIRAFGKYSDKLAFLASWLALGSPAFYFARRGTVRSEGDGGSGLPSRIEHRKFRVFLSFSLAFGLASVVSYGLARSIPDATGPVQPLDLAKLGDSEPPSGRVRLIGTVDQERGTVLEEEINNSKSETAYLPVIPKDAKDGEGSEKPIRYFVQVKMGKFVPGVEMKDGMAINLEGVLLKNGLPGVLKKIYDDDRIAVASPHFVLVGSVTDLRMPYYMAAGICALLFVALGVSSLRERITARGNRPAV